MIESFISRNIYSNMKGFYTKPFSSLYIHNWTIYAYVTNKRRHFSTSCALTVLPVPHTTYTTNVCQEEQQQAQRSTFTTTEVYIYNDIIGEVSGKQTAQLSKLVFLKI